MAAKESEPKERGMICEDIELKTMQKISRLLAKLDEPAKIRVVAWLTDKLKFPLVVDQK